MGKTYRGRDKDWARREEKARRQSEKHGYSARDSRFRPHKRKSDADRWQ